MECEQKFFRSTGDLKAIFPEALIVIGGYSVPKLPHRITELFQKHPYIDVLVHDEGELAFAEFLRQHMDGRAYHKIQGLTFKTFDVQEGFISNPRGARIECMDDLPSPFLNGTFDKLIKTYGSKITGVLWETNRGCPYSCTFCDWGNAAVNKIKSFSLERLREEIAWISDQKFYYMFLTDANFGIFVKRDMEIAGYIADCHVKNGFPHHVITNWPKNKGEDVVAIAERLAKGGVACNITMAIQSTNPETLKVVKRVNLAKGKIDKLKSMFHDRHIPTYVEVILGLPMETYETFSAGLNTILSNRLEDRFFMYLCQMLENTELASPESREKYQLETRHCRHTINNRQFDWNDEDIEYEEFVVGTSTMPINDWTKAYVLGYFLTVLYNHRAAVFPLIYLKEEYGILPVDALEFIISHLQENRDSFPVLARNLAHIENQAQLMLDGISTMSELPEVEKLVVLPHVGSLIILSFEKDKFYDELHRIFKEFFIERQLGLEVDALIFEEILIYQKMRFPVWPQKATDEYLFKTAIPNYFQVLTAGLEAQAVEKIPTAVIFKDHERKVETSVEFAAILVRGGLTVDLLSADIQGADRPRDEDELARLRWEMEQRSLDKLKVELDHLHK